MIQVSLTRKILVTSALTLIALPMSVFAQTETVGDIFPTEISPEEVTEVQVQQDTLYDDYKRENLPDVDTVFDDFVVGPGRFTLEIAPGESKTVMMNVSNRLGDERTFQFTTEDMKAAEGDGNATTQLLGDAVGPYTIKDYVSVPYKKIRIGSNKRAVVPVTISIPPNAEPGGFYGSILTEVLPEANDVEREGAAPTAPVISRIGTLIFVTTPGDIDRSGSFVDFTTIPKKTMYVNGPIDMGIVFENTGSVHFTPSGTVSVTNLLGETVGQVDILPWFVMPDSVRTKELSWDREFLLGRYVVTADINLGYSDTTEAKQIVFWVLPWKFLVTVFAGFFIFFLFIRFILRNFEFKRK